MPTAIENIILRYIKSKADWWCSYVYGAFCITKADIDLTFSELHITTGSVSGVVQPLIRRS
jgi:hypothetical protein